MIQRQLNPHQLDELELLCQTILVHPNNGTETAGKEGVSNDAQWSELCTQFADKANPGVVLSLIQQIKGKNRPIVHR